MHTCKDCPTCVLVPLSTAFLQYVRRKDNKLINVYDSLTPHVLFAYVCTEARHSQRWQVSIQAKIIKLPSSDLSLVHTLAEAVIAFLIQFVKYLHEEIRTFPHS